MWFKMRKVDLGFLATAKKTYVAECDLQSSRHDVWNALIDATTWRHWWPGVSSASYGGTAPPYGVGTFREATVHGQRYEEYVVACDEAQRWAYYIDRATVPIAEAQLECTELMDHGRGTRVRWTLAQDPRWLMRLIAPVFPRLMRALLQRAMANLDAYIVAQARERGVSS